MRVVKMMVLALMLAVPLTGYAAVGIGLEAGGGSGTHEENEFSREFDVDTSYANLSFVFETNPYAKGSNISYRLNVGLEGHNFEDEAGTTMETGALVFDNTLAFTLTKSGQANFWVGPQLRIGFLGGETDREFLGEPIELGGVMFGLGGVIGVNLRTVEQVGLGFSAGVRSTGFAGTEEWRGAEDDFEMSAGEGFVNACVLFD